MDLADMTRQLRRLQRMSENLGLVSLGLIAGDVSACLERKDVTAFSAVWARLDAGGRTVPGGGSAGCWV